jgi:hypothetical protein
MTGFFTNKMKKTFTIGVFLFSLVFFANGANAEYDFYYFNDFESCSTPGTFYNCDNNWTSYDGNSAEIYEMPGGSFSGTKFVGGVKGNIYETPPLLEGSFSFMLKINGANDQTFFIGNRTGNSWDRLAGFSITGTYCSSDVFYKYGLSGQYETASLPAGTTCVLDTWQKWSIEWKNESGRLYLRIGHNNFFTDWFLQSVGWQNITHFAIMTGSAYDVNNSVAIDDIKITSPAELPPAPYLWSDWCGSDAGTLIETTPVNLCDVGTAGTVGFDGSKWSWDCIDGVVSQSCRAYLATTEPVDGTCGAWDGETFNTWPPLTELCELKTSLVVPSMVETISGYTWTCSGINGGSTAYCSGNKTSPPLMPELPPGSLDDCTGLGVLESLVCNIGNTIKTIFLPSSEKINELNETINKMSSKFPFSYISKAMETFNDVKGNITETSMLELSIMGSEKSSIDFSTIAFFDYIKMLTTILIVLVFSFWLIRFIKHIF